MGEYVYIWPILALALIHFFGGRLSFLGGTSRSVWLSAAGGVSVSYIFLHLFPELQEGQQQVAETFGSFGFLEHHIYLLALMGLCIFCGLERAVVVSKGEQAARANAEQRVPAFSGCTSAHSPFIML